AVRGHEVRCPTWRQAARFRRRRAGRAFCEAGHWARALLSLTRAKSPMGRRHYRRAGTGGQPARTSTSAGPGGAWTLGEIRAPTLVIWRADDPTVPVECAAVFPSGM